MQKKDRIKSIVALIILGSIGISYYFFGKDVSKYVALVGFGIWFISMYFMNKK